MNNQEIIYRYRNPVYAGDVDVFLEKESTPGEKVRWVEDENPFCGDSLRLALRITEEGKIKEAIYDGYGCSLCIASTEWLLESVTGCLVSEDLRTREEVLHGLGDVQVSKNRSNCVDLSLRMMKSLQEQWEGDV